MKSQFVVLMLVSLSLMAVGFAFAHDDHICPHHEATVSALRTCVEHASAHGHVDSAGITKSLLAKLDAAQAAIDRGQPSTGINILEAFIHQVEGQSGNHIDAAHAEHLVSHAKLVIQALSE